MWLSSVCVCVCRCVCNRNNIRSCVRFFLSLFSFTSKNIHCVRASVNDYVVGCLQALTPFLCYELMQQNWIQKTYQHHVCKCGCNKHPFLLLSFHHHLVVLLCEQFKCLSFHFSFCYSLVVGKKQQANISFKLHTLPHYAAVFCELYSICCSCQTIITTTRLVHLLYKKQMLWPTQMATTMKVFWFEKVIKESTMLFQLVFVLGCC